MTERDIAIATLFVLDLMFAWFVWDAIFKSENRFAVWLQWRALDLGSLLYRGMQWVLRQTLAR